GGDLPLQLLPDLVVGDAGRGDARREDHGCRRGAAADVLVGALVAGEVEDVGVVLGEEVEVAAVGDGRVEVRHAGLDVGGHVRSPHHRHHLDVRDDVTAVVVEPRVGGRRGDRVTLDHAAPLRTDGLGVDR